jgi:hypothetical protein
MGFVLSLSPCFLHFGFINAPLSFTFEADFHEFEEITKRALGAVESSGDVKGRFASGHELKKPMLFYFVLVGLSLFCISVIIHVSFSGEIGWSK